MTRSACELSEAYVIFVEGSVLPVLHPFFLSEQESAKSNASRSPVAPSGSVGAQADMYEKLENVKQLYVAPLKCGWWEVDEAAYCTEPLLKAEVLIWVEEVSLKNLMS